MRKERETDVSPWVEDTTTTSSAERAKLETYAESSEAANVDKLRPRLIEESAEESIEDGESPG